MERETIWKKELTYIKNKKYRENAVKLIELLPDYFFEVPASSTGKYHPSYSLGEGGLLRHTKAVVRIGYELLQNNTIGGIFTPEEKDLMIIAMIMHDGVKSGIPKEKYTRFDHPLLASKLIKEHQEELTLTKGEVEFICHAIESHMGEWNKDYNGNEVLPLPKDRYQKFVHMCDFLGSRKFLHVDFDEENTLID